MLLVGSLVTALLLLVMLLLAWCRRVGLLPCPGCRGRGWLLLLLLYQ
jgi:hypothetical protein